MKILFICDEYPPGRIGGIGTAVQLLARELVRQGHNVFVAGLYPYSYGAADHETDQGVQVWRKRYGYDFRRFRLLEKIYRRLPGTIRSRFNTRQAFTGFTAFIDSLTRKEEIDVIEIADWNTFALYAGFKVEWPRFSAPLLLKSHGSYTYFAEETGDDRKKFMRAIDQALFKRADGHAAVSQYTAEKNNKLFGPELRIKVLYNGVESLNANKLRKNQAQVLFAGSLVEKKGVFQLIKAWNLVVTECPELRLIIAGKGKQTPLRNLLSDKARETVTFLGHISRSELLEQFESSCIAALPSYSETFGLVAIEAMAMGCSVIFTRRSCGPEIVQHEVTGLLVDPDNVEEIRTAILRLYKDKNLRERLVQEALERTMKRFGISNSARDHITFYQEQATLFKNRKNKSER